MPCFAPLEILLIATAQIIFCITIDLHRESFCLADDAYATYVTMAYHT